MLGPSKEDLGSWVQCRLNVCVRACTCTGVHSTSGSERRRLKVGKNGEGRLGKVKEASGVREECREQGKGEGSVSWGPVTRS